MLLAVTIIGIPFAWQHVKLAMLSLTPVGKMVIEVGERMGGASSGDVLRERAATRQIFVSITDTGGGMSEEVRQRLFEPYFTTKEGGSGLGLAQVYGTVAQAGGGIEIESEAGVGTRIRLVFPRYPEPLDLPE